MPKHTKTVSKPPKLSKAAFVYQQKQSNQHQQSPGSRAANEKISHQKRIDNIRIRDSHTHTEKREVFIDGKKYYLKAAIHYDCTYIIPNLCRKIDYTLYTANNETIKTISIQATLKPNPLDNSWQVLEQLRSDGLCFNENVSTDVIIDHAKDIFLNRNTTNDNDTCNYTSGYTNNVQLQLESTGLDPKIGQTINQCIASDYYRLCLETHDNMNWRNIIAGTVSGVATLIILAFIIEKFRRNGGFSKTMTNMACCGSLFTKRTSSTEQTMPTDLRQNLA